MHTNTTSKERKKICDSRKLTIFCEIDDRVPDDIGDKILFIRIIQTCSLPVFHIRLS